MQQHQQHHSSTTTTTTSSQQMMAGGGAPMMGQPMMMQQPGMMQQPAMMQPPMQQAAPQAAAPPAEEKSSGGGMSSMMKGCCCFGICCYCVVMILLIVLLAAGGGSIAVIRTLVTIGAEMAIPYPSEGYFNSGAILVPFTETEPRAIYSPQEMEKMATEFIESTSPHTRAEYEKDPFLAFDHPLYETAFSQLEYYLEGVERNIEKGCTDAYKGWDRSLNQCAWKDCSGPTRPDPGGIWCVACPKTDKDEIQDPRCTMEWQMERAAADEISLKPLYDQAAQQIPQFKPMISTFKDPETAKSFVQAQMGGAGGPPGRL